MTPNGPAKIARCLLWVSPAIIVPIVFFASMPWLQRQHDSVTLAVAAAASIFVMGYSLFLAARVTRRLDEVEIAGQRFAQTQGMVIGWIAATLVMMIPPAMTALADLAAGIAEGSPEKAVRLGIVIGFMLVVILQTLGMAVVSVWWGRRLGGRA